MALLLRSPSLEASVSALRASGKPGSDAVAALESAVQSGDNARIRSALTACSSTAMVYAPRTVQAFDLAIAFTDEPPGPPV